MKRRSRQELNTARKRRRQQRLSDTTWRDDCNNDSDYRRRVKRPWQSFDKTQKTICSKQLNMMIATRIWCITEETTTTTRNDNEDNHSITRERDDLGKSSTWRWRHNGNNGLDYRRRVTRPRQSFAMTEKRRSYTITEHSEKSQTTATATWVDEKEKTAAIIWYNEKRRLWASFGLSKKNQRPWQSFGMTKKRRSQQ